jgi:predicted O-methyltransferase YrrM
MPSTSRIPRLPWRRRSQARVRRALRRLIPPHGERIALALRRHEAGQFVGGATALRAVQELQRALLISEDRLAGDQPSLSDDQDRTIRELAQDSIPIRWGRLLYQLVRAWQPDLGVELGTALGISTAYQAVAMKLHGRGLLVTLEASPARMARAEANLQRLGLDNVEFVTGYFEEVLSSVLGRLPRVEYAFIDGHHQQQATLDNFDTLWQASADPALLVFDDIRWSDGMRRAWKSLTEDSRTALAVDLGRMGLIVTSHRPAGERHLLDYPI